MAKVAFIGLGVMGFADLLVDRQVLVDEAQPAFLRQRSYRRRDKGGENRSARPFEQLLLIQN